MRTDRRLFTTILLALAVAGWGVETGWGVTPLVAQADQAEAVEAEEAEADEETVTDRVEQARAEARETAARQARARASDMVSIFSGSRTVAAGDTVNDAVVIGGSLHVRGTVLGDAVVIAGTLNLYEESHVMGDVVAVGGRVRDRGARIGGGLVDGASRTATREATDGRTVVRVDRGRDRSPFERVRRGFAGILTVGGLFIALGLIGAILVFYGRSLLETVSDTVRASTLRSAGAGLAGGLLAGPVYLVLIVTLAITIVGIPLLVLVVPFYPVAIALAGAFGLLAAAHAVGERTIERRGSGYEYRNSYAYLFLGMGVLFLPIVVGHLVGMTPFLGFVGGMIRFLAWLAVLVAATIGFGAVILSRLGTRRTFADPPRVAASVDPLEEELAGKE